MRVGLSIRDVPAEANRKIMQGSVDQVVGDLQRYRALGVSTVLLETRYRDLDDMLRIYETVAREIRPRL